MQTPPCTVDVQFPGPTRVSFGPLAPSRRNARSHPLGLRGPGNRFARPVGFAHRPTSSHVRHQAWSGPGGSFRASIISLNRRAMAKRVYGVCSHGQIGIQLDAAPHPMCDECRSLSLPRSSDEWICCVCGGKNPYASMRRPKKYRPDHSDVIPGACLHEGLEMMQRRATLTAGTVLLSTRWTVGDGTATWSFLSSGMPVVDAACPGARSTLPSTERSATGSTKTTTTSTTIHPRRLTVRSTN